MSESKMSVNELIAQHGAALGEVQAAIDACTDEQWQLPMIDQDRTVGVVFHHIVWGEPFVVDWALLVGRGAELPAMSMDDIHEINAQHAQQAAGVSREETKALLKTNSQIVHEKLETLADADLQKAASMAAMGGQEVTAQQIVEWFMINHARGHLQEIEATLKAG